MSDRISLEELDAEFEKVLREDRESAALLAPPPPPAAKQEPQPLWLNCQDCGPQQMMAEKFRFRGNILCPRCMGEWPFKVNLTQPPAPPPTRRAAPPGLLL